MFRTDRQSLGPTHCSTESCLDGRAVEVSTERHKETESQPASERASERTSGRKRIETQAEERRGVAFQYQFVPRTTRRRRHCSTSTMSLVDSG